MKHLKFISLLLVISLLITGCCENKNEEQTTREETSLVNTQEVSNKITLFIDE